MGFIGLPPEGANASIPVIGKPVLRLYSSDAQGRYVELAVYADGRMIWQKEAFADRVHVDVPEGANQFSSGYLEQALTTEGVKLLRSRVLSTDLFEHNLRLDAGRHHPPITIWARKGDRLVFVSAYRLRPWDRPKDLMKETPAQGRALVQLEAVLADPAAWLPTTAWADREIRAYVASRYHAVYDRGKPDPSTLPSAVRELLVGYGLLVHGGCLTTDEARAVIQGLRDAGLQDIGAPHEIGFDLSGPSHASYLYFHPALPETKC
jgi:hypothetical protein